MVLYAFRFLRQPSSPIAPRPVAKRGRAAGRGVALLRVAAPTRFDGAPQHKFTTTPSAKTNISPPAKLTLPAS